MTLDRSNGTTKLDSEPTKQRRTKKNTPLLPTRTISCKTEQTISTYRMIPQG